MVTGKVATAYSISIHGRHSWFLMKPGTVENRVSPEIFFEWRKEEARLPVKVSERILGNRSKTLL